MRRIHDWLDAHREYGAFFLRLLVGVHLVVMSHDNVLHHERMLEFRDYLDAHGFPFPLVCAHVSVYAQLAAGILFVLGLFVRPAAAVMVFNFVVAIVGVHRDTPYAVTFPALVMLAGALFLLLHGAGAPSLDRWRARKRA